eukprot:10903215-Heterocapsa_arctica.AAC.1
MSACVSSLTAVARLGWVLVRSRQSASSPPSWRASWIASMASNCRSHPSVKDGCWMRMGSSRADRDDGGHPCALSRPAARA